MKSYTSSFHLNKSEISIPIQKTLFSISLLQQAFHRNALVNSKIYNTEQTSQFLNSQIQLQPSEMFPAV